MNVQDDCAGCVSCFVCLLFGCVYIAATETTANQLQCWKPTWRTDQKGGNQVRYMHTHEQKRQRIHDYDGMHLTRWAHKVVQRKKNEPETAAMLETDLENRPKKAGTR